MKTRMGNLIVVTTVFSLFANYQTKAEILEVPSYGTPTVTSSPLEDGKVYIIEARRTFEYDSYWDRFADAEWAQKNWPYSPEPWVENVDHPVLDDVLDLLINEVPRDWMGTTDGVNFSAHTYSPSHVYRLEWLGTGEAITFRIEDAIGSSQYDNIGSLEVEIVPICAVSIDVKPGSCPNPLNVKDKGLLSVAILGSQDLDVRTIDADSIVLVGIAPVRSSYEDVATPMPDGAEVCECTTAGADGYLDLVLKFNVQDIVAALGPVNNGDELELTLTGALDDGTPIEGTDCVVIRGAKWRTSL